jgi:hypothetical protein
MKRQEKIKDVEPEAPRAFADSTSSASSWTGSFAAASVQRREQRAAMETIINQQDNTETTKENQKKHTA